MSVARGPVPRDRDVNRELSLAIVAWRGTGPRPTVTESRDLSFAIAGMAGDRPPPYVPETLFICHTMNVVRQLTKRNPRRCQVLLTHELLRGPDVCLLSILLALRRNLRRPVSI